MIDTLIFDLDGTLLNTLDDLADSVNYALSSLGYPVRTVDEVRMMVGNSVVYLINKALPEGTAQAEVQRCISVFEQHYNGNMFNKTAPYRDVLQMLDEVKSLGYKTAVVSNKPDLFTKKLVQEHFGEYISLAIGRNDDMPRKPAPDMVQYAMDRLSSDQSTTAYVGDSEVDVKTSKNAGLPCVGCLWGFRDRETLEKEGADCLISSPLQLVRAIQKIM